MPGRYEHRGRSDEARPSTKSTSRCAGATRRPPPATNAACSSAVWKAIPASTPSVRCGARSSGVTSTTMPALAKPSPRLEGDQPLTTTSSPLVAAGQITPPGHMQNENTPRPSTWRTSAYDAAGTPRGRVVQRYWIWSTSAWGCSTRTPTANGFASSARPRRWRSASTSRAECPVARTTPRPATWSPAAVTTPVTAPLASVRSVTRVPAHHRRRPAHVTASRRRRRLGPERLVDPHPDAEHAHERSLPRIERTPHDHVVRDRARRDAEPVRETVRALPRVVVRIGRESDLGLGDHAVRRGREARRGMLLSVGGQRAAAAPVDGWKKQWRKLARGSSGTSRACGRRRRPPGRRAGAALRTHRGRLRPRRPAHLTAPAAAS